MPGPYLFASNSGAMTPVSLMLHLGVVVAAISCAALARRRHDGGWLLACLLVPLAAAARIMAIPVLSARIFLLGASALCLLGLVNLVVRPRYDLRSWLHMVALEPGVVSRADGRADLLVLTIHIAGMMALWSLFQVSTVQSVVLAAISIAALLAPQIAASARTRRMTLQAGLLSPLFLVYGVAAARLMFKYTFGWLLPTFAAGQVADVHAALLTTENVLLAALAYVALIQIALHASSRAQVAARASALLFSLTAIWGIWEYFGYRTSGVTATDPYAYVQMAVDWAERGSPLHEFPIFEVTAALDIPYYAAVHQGYRLPSDLPFGNLRDAPSVWPTGMPLLLLLGYRLLGEPGLYLIAPMFGLLSVFLTAILARQAGRDCWQLCAAIAAMLLATSFEQIDRLLVPMADVPAQFFSLLAVVAVLAATAARPSVPAPSAGPARHGPDHQLPHPTDFLVFLLGSRDSNRRLILLGAAGGAALGVSYWIRHTQVLLSLPILVAVLFTWRIPGWQARARFLIPCGLAALLLSVPDLAYHQQVFGNVFKFESEELQHFRVDTIVPTLSNLSEEFARGHEFGFVFPLTILGGAWMARSQPRLFVLLFTWVLTLLAFHVPYSALRLRDLLPQLPPVALWTAWGAAGLVTGGWTRTLASRGVPPEVRQAILACTLLVVLLSLSMRTQTTLARTLRSHGAAFGYLTAGERAAFDQVREVTERDSVIAASLHSGPLDLYSRRDSIRPQVWTSAQLDRFLDQILSQGRVAYLLYDGPPLRPHLERLRAEGRLQVIAQFNVLTFFGDAEPESGTLFKVVR